MVIWLALLLPGQLQQHLGPLNPATTGTGVFGVVLALALGRWLSVQRSRLRQHLPRGRLTRTFLLASEVSLAIRGLEAVILWLLVQAIIPAAAVSTGKAISIYLLSGTADMASLLQGGLGVNETDTMLLRQTGTTNSLALSIAIVRRLCSVWLIMALEQALVWCQPRRSTSPGLKHRFDRAEQNDQIQPGAEVLQVVKVVREFEF